MADTRRILLVDDELSVVKMVGKRLELEGFDVLVALDGEDALHKAQTERVDLVILDLMLPKLNGFDVCQALKRDPRWQRTPVVIFTAKTHEADEKKAMACGADAYVRKPFRAEELIGKIRLLLGAAPESDAAPP